MRGVVRALGLAGGIVVAWVPALAAADPACEPEGGLTCVVECNVENTRLDCGAAWIHVRTEGLQQCANALPDALEACQVTCTLDLPPSRCNTAVVEFGLRSS